MPEFAHSGFTVGYTCAGNGTPIVLLHGNTGAGRMLESEIEYYSRSFRVLAVDLIGHGTSKRIPDFPDGFWHVNACVVLALCARLNCLPAHIVGSSGGAIVALTMALEAPSGVRSVVADSFTGERLSPAQAEIIAQERQAAKQGPGCEFWTAMHGAGWEQVVDADTRMLLRFSQCGGRYFQRDLKHILCPVLITASLEDQLIGNAREVVQALAAHIPRCETELFETGGHPAMLSNCDGFRARTLQFLAGC